MRLRKNWLWLGGIVLTCTLAAWAQTYSFGAITVTTLSASGQITSTLATGTAPFVIASTTLVANLHSATADNLGGATFASPGPIGSSTPSTGVFTTLLTSISNSLGGGYLSETRVVSAALTTTAGLIVKTAAAANTVSTAALSDVSVAGIAITSQTAGQNVEIAVKGVTACIADNTVTLGDLVGVGTTTAGRCKDLGATSALTISNQLQIVGKALSSAAAAGSFSVQIYSQGIYGLAIATAQLPTAILVNTCEIAVGDPGAASSLLVDDNDTPQVCANDTAQTMTITAVHCYAPAGSPTVTPIITGGAANSILTGALTCSSTTGGAAGTLNGTPTQTTGQLVDMNITTAGGTAKYLVIRLTRTL